MRTVPPRVRSSSLLATAAVVALVVTACGGDRRIVATRARVQVPANSAVAALWIDLRSEGGDDDVLERVEVDAPGATAQLHETVIDDRGTATMQPQRSIPVPAGETVVLGPGSLHVMVLRPPELTAGDTLGFTLHFRDAGAVEVTADVVDEVEP